MGLPSAAASALQQVCKERCAGTRWADRTFSEGVSDGIAGDSALFAKGADGTLLERLQAAGIPNAYILRQFLADQDFGWRLDSLRTRAAYAVTIAEAQKMIRTQGGLVPDELRTVPASYLVAVHAANVEQKSGKDLFGKPTVDVAAKLWVSVYKLGFDTPQELGNALGGYYCEPGCKDRDARQAAFRTYTVPFRHVAAFTANASGSASEKEGVEKALVSLGEDMLSELATEMAAKIPAFAIAERVIALDPPAARIGKKEGIERGARFFHYKTEQGADGKPAEKLRAVLVARKVADNRVMAVDASGPVGGKVARVDSTTFSQVYPGGVQRGDVIREKPSDISLHAGGALLNGSPGVIGEVRTESLLGSLGLPPGTRVYLSSKYFLNSFDDGYGYTGSYGLIFLGGGLGYEFFPVRGKLRLMPLLGYNRVQTKPINKADTELAGSSYGLEAGADVGIRLSPTFELTGTLRSAAYGDPLTVEVAQGLIFGIGARLQRGRFGF